MKPSIRLDFEPPVERRTVTGLTLIVGGCGSVDPPPLGTERLLVSLGMQTDCVVYSVWVFAQQGAGPAAAWFVFVARSTIILIGALLVQASRTSAS